MNKKGLKSLLVDYLGDKRNKLSKKMYFRPYNPQTEEIVCNYSKADWHRIFPHMIEENLKEMSTCTNVVILIWCDSATNTPHGMLYLEENFHNRGEVLFHGGTWNHDRWLYKDIFLSLVALLDFILVHKYTISTTCSIDNSRANKFQESLCFKEVRRDNTTIYKTLDKSKYASSYYVNKLRTVSIKPLIEM